MVDYLFKDNFIKDKNELLLVFFLSFPKWFPNPANRQIVMANDGRIHKPGT
jgi:hypothetical protein